MRIPNNRDQQQQQHLYLYKNKGKLRVIINNRMFYEEKLLTIDY